MPEDAGGGRRGLPPLRRRARRAARAEDVHWAVQHDARRAAPARPRRPRRADRRDARAAARARRRRAAGARPGRENRSAAAAAAGRLRRAARARSCASATRPTSRPSATTPPARRRRPTSRTGRREVAPLLPVLRTTIDDHARLGQLHRRRAAARAARAGAPRRRSRRRARAQVGHARSPTLTNLEGDDRLQRALGLGRRRADARLHRGACASSDEARTLPWSLPPLLRAVERVVLVDNGSTDGTRRRRPPRRRRGRARPTGSRSHDYPFAVARCGAEHLAHAGRLGPQPRLLLQLVVRARAHRATRSSGTATWCSPTPRSRALRDLAWQLEAAERGASRSRATRSTSADDRARSSTPGCATASRGRGPTGPGYSFVKAIDWELPLWGADVADARRCPTGAASSSSTSTPTSSATGRTPTSTRSARTRRKRREWEVFHALARRRRAAARRRRDRRARRAPRRRPRARRLAARAGGGHRALSAAR